MLCACLFLCLSVPSVSLYRKKGEKVKTEHFKMEAEREGEGEAEKQLSKVNVGGGGQLITEQ